mmetsp:Transcript_697/g.2807  ORF Transcript_697/g.2807 Transcript_697/m.2807 type:complete len:219 (-) Transcript_697:906-1562(-)
MADEVSTLSSLLMATSPSIAARSSSTVASSAWRPSRAISATSPRPPVSIALFARWQILPIQLRSELRLAGFSLAGDGSAEPAGDSIAGWSPPGAASTLSPPIVLLASFVMNAAPASNVMLDAGWSLSMSAEFWKASKSSSLSLEVAVWSPSPSASVARMCSRTPRAARLATVATMRRRTSLACRRSISPCVVWRAFASLLKPPFIFCLFSHCLRAREW